MAAENTATQRPGNGVTAEVPSPPESTAAAGAPAEVASPGAVRDPVGAIVRGLKAGNGLGLLGIVLFLVIWEIVGRVIDSAVILVPASAVASDLWNWITSGDIWPDLRTSLVEFALGLLVGTVCGIVFGGVMGLMRPVQRLTRPLVLALYSTPTLALAPLFVIWLGYGLGSKLVLIALVAVFPLLVNTEVGIRQADRAFIDVARSFGATPMQTTRSVRLPAALPFVFAGMQIAVTRATVGIFVAELFGSTHGIGYTITNAAAVFNTARLLSGVVVLAAFGVLMAGLVSRLAVRVTPWQSGENQGRA